MSDNGDLYDAMGEEFDATSVEPNSGYEPLKAGWYAAYIDDATVKDTKSGTGKYLKIEMSVVTEGYNGRKLWPNINLRNANEKAVEIGRRDLAAIALACGLRTLKSSDELIGKTIMVRVKVEKAAEGYDPDNKITAYKPMKGSEAQQNAPQGSAAAAPVPRAETAAPPQQKAPETAATKRPWE